MFCVIYVGRKSTRPEIALVEPVGADQSSCSRSALVIAVSRIPSRKTAIIMAEDSGFGSIIVQNHACDNLYLDKDDAVVCS